MFYLQLDLPFACPTDVKRRLAGLGAIHAEIMRADERRVSIAFRELAARNLWRCRPTSPTPPPC